MGLLSGVTGNAGGIDLANAQSEFRSVLIPGEVIHGAFQFYRDVVLLTDRRYLEVDYQGVTGSKVQFLSVPWGRISAFAVETPGTVDLDSELKLWVSGMSPVSSGAKSAGCSVLCRFDRNVDAMAVERILADHLCPVAAPGGHAR